MNIRLISVLSALALAASIGMCEAKSGGKTHASKETNTVSNVNKKLMVTIAKGNMAELKLSELAQSQTTNPQVKSFAQMMLDGHTKMGNELSNLASGKGVSLPSTPDAASEAALTRLKRLSGPAFDKAYMAQMVAGHRKVLGVVRSLAAHTKAPDVKTFAEGGIPVVTKHLDLAQQIQKSLTATATRTTPGAH